MDIRIKFIDGEEITIHGAKNFVCTDELWKVCVDNNLLYFSKSQVKYIGREYYFKGEN